MLNVETKGYAAASDRDLPVVVALMPATSKQRAVAAGIAVVIIAFAVLVAPFAHLQIGKIDSFVPVLQTVLSAADLLTAILLLAQYSVQPHRSLLAIASAYLFSASFAFLQTLSFPGGYAPGGLIGDGFNTPAWFFVLWHTAFFLCVLSYASLKEINAPIARSPAASIALTLGFVCGAVALSATLVTVGVEHLPSFYTASVTLQTRLGNQINIALFVFGAFLLLLLFARSRTVLDLWLMVTLLAWLPNFLVAAVASSVRFSAGWYAARGFALVASCMLLSVLLTEMTVLYSRLASALTMQRRERANRLVSIDAATAAIAHEVRSPLGSITLNASTALQMLQAQPPRLEEVNVILRDMEEASLRVNETIRSVRGLFKDAADQPAAIDIEEVTRQVLRLLQHELQLNEVSVVTEFHVDGALVRADPVQLQQVILNLLKNALEAMNSTSAGGRRLFVGTRLDRDAVVLFVRDNGAGVCPRDQGRIFEPFFTTKQAGMGLGLPICRMIVERYDGSLVLAESGRHGSTFEVALPAIHLA